MTTAVLEEGFLSKSQLLLEVRGSNLHQQIAHPEISLCTSFQLNRTVNTSYRAFFIYWIRNRFKVPFYSNSSRGRVYGQIVIKNDIQESP